MGCRVVQLHTILAAMGGCQLLIVADWLRTKVWGIRLTVLTRKKGVDPS